MPDQYRIILKIDDTQSHTASRRAIQDAKAIEDAWTKAARAQASMLRVTGTGSVSGPPGDSGASRARVKQAKDESDQVIGAKRRAANETARIYTREEARARANAREIQRINRQMIADQEALARANARALGPRGVAGMKTLTREEHGALDYYSGDSKYVQGTLRGRQFSEYQKEAMRDSWSHSGSSRTGDYNHAKATALLDAAIRKGTLAKQTTLYRGTSLEAFGLTGVPKVGETLRDKAYISTTPSSEVASRFGSNVRMTIRAPKGLHGADVSDATGGKEQEVLLARQQQLRIRSVHTDEQGVHYIEADALRSHAENEARREQAQILRARRQDQMSEADRIRAARAEVERATMLKARAASGGSGRGRGGSGGVGSGSESGPHIDIGLHKLQIDTVKDLQKREAAIANLESRYAARDYQRRTKSEAKKIALTERTAEREKAAIAAKAAEIEGIESKFAARDYKARVKAEKDKQRLDDFARSRTEKSIKDQETLESSYIARDYQRRVENEKKKAKLEEGPAVRGSRYRRRELTEAEAQSNAINKITDVENKRRIEGIAKVMGEERLSFAEAIHSAMNLDQVLTGVGVTMLAFKVGGTLVRGMANAFAEAKRNADAMAEKTLATVAGLRALASVAGRKPDEEYGSEVLKFGVQTGLGAEHAARFQESFLGRAQIVKGKQISDQAGPKGAPSEFDKYMRSAGTLATAKGIPDEVAADLAGAILKVENFKAKAQGADEATSRLMGAYKILDAGTGKMAILGPQLNKTLAELTTENKLEGVFRNAGEAAVATSVAAEHDPGEAGTMVARTSVGLRDFENKDKKAFFKRAGITERDSFLEAIAKSNKVIGEEVAKGIPVDTAIKSFGFSEIRETRGMKTFFLARNTVLKEQLKNLAETEGPGATAAAKKNLKALTQEKTFRDAQSNAMIEEAEYEVGRRSSDLKIAKKRAQAQLTLHEGYKDSVFGHAGTLNQYAAGAFTGFTRKGSDVVVEERALKLLKEEAGEGSVGGDFRATTTAMYGDPAAEAKRLSDKIEKRRKARQLHVVLPPGLQRHEVKSGFRSIPVTREPTVKHRQLRVLLPPGLQDSGMASSGHGGFDIPSDSPRKKRSRFDDPNVFRSGVFTTPGMATRLSERLGKARAKDPGWVPAAEWRQTPQAMARLGRTSFDPAPPKYQPTGVPKWMPTRNQIGQMRYAKLRKDNAEYRARKQKLIKEKKFSLGGFHHDGSKPGRRDSQGFDMTPVDTSSLAVHGMHVTPGWTPMPSNAIHPANGILTRNQIGQMRYTKLRKENAEYRARVEKRKHEAARIVRQETGNISLPSQSELARIGEHGRIRQRSRQEDRILGNSHTTQKQRSQIRDAHAGVSADGSNPKLVALLERIAKSNEAMEKKEKEKEKASHRTNRTPPGVPLDGPARRSAR